MITRTWKVRSSHAMGAFHSTKIPWLVKFLNNVPIMLPRFLQVWATLRAVILSPRSVASELCLVPRRLPFDENMRAMEGGKETTGETSASPAVCTLPMVPCGSSPVTRFALASAMRKTKRLRRRLVRTGEITARRAISAWFKLFN